VKKHILSGIGEDPDQKSGQTEYFFEEKR